MSGYVTVDGIKVPIEGEANLLALIRKANIDLPTFCYHSHLSTYGACRLCLVEIDGKDIDASCVVPPKDGMSLRTSTPKIRAMRRTNLELLLANHKQDCPTCSRSADCRLRGLASRMGIREVRFRRTREEKPLDLGSPCLVRDPNKCILCGDCVRYCAEIQGIGAIDFAHRGGEACVTPAFGRSLGEVDCVNCGQCAAICPTGAIVPRSSVDEVWREIDDPKAKVVAQIAPAVRVALGERFGLPPGTITTGRISTALRMLGFDAVYDTAFGADLTVVEEAKELVERLAASEAEKLPLFTSCCPAWVKFAEQSFPSLLPRLSSCMSPQSMLGSVLREDRARSRTAGGDDGRRLRVVSVMPCVAKKYEIARPELSLGGARLVDYVLTTSELAAMIEEAGIRFQDLPQGSMDQPLGFASGAGIVFGRAGGVAEAVARYAASSGSGGSPAAAPVLDFAEESPGVRVAEFEALGRAITVLSVEGLANAKRVARQILAGERKADVVEVMACPGGCVGGAGQPITADPSRRALRAGALAQADGERELRSARDNPFIAGFYRERLGCEPGDGRAHELLHTRFSSKKRIADEAIPLVRGSGEGKIPVKVCVGTSCFLRGSQAILGEILRRVEAEGLADYVDVSATFCGESCGMGPTATVGGVVLAKTSQEAVMDELLAQVGKLRAAVRA
jgi:NADH-quinone oxidoreductase subunit G